MNLLGRDIPVRELVSRIEERLQLRGLSEEPDTEDMLAGPEPRVDPLSFNLGALEEHADPTRPLPLHTHRGGVGQAQFDTARLGLDAPAQQPVLADREAVPRRQRQGMRVEVESDHAKVYKPALERSP